MLWREINMYKMTSDYSLYWLCIMSFLLISLSCLLYIIRAFCCEFGCRPSLLHLFNCFCISLIHSQCHVSTCWLSSFPFPLLVPSQGLANDVRCRFHDIVFVMQEIHVWLFGILHSWSTVDWMRSMWMKFIDIRKFVMKSFSSLNKAQICPSHFHHLCDSDHLVFLPH